MSVTLGRYTVSAKKPLALTTTSKQYILREIVHERDDEVVVFLTVQGKSPVRICRMLKSGTVSYKVPIDKNVSFTLKGKGSCTLIFTEHALMEEGEDINNTTSYMCDIITEDEMKKTL